MRQLAYLCICALGLTLWSCGTTAQDSATMSYSCASPPPDLAGCSVDADCGTIAIGCYCGAQPVNGIARKYVATAATCEETSASKCALGCANEPGEVAQDGTKAAAGAAFAVHCDHSGSAGVCKSAGTGSGAPMTGGW